MKSVRIYKDNVRENMLRSLFFSDSVLFIGGGLLIAITVGSLEKVVFHIGQLGVLGMSIVAAEVLYGVAITMQVEKQPLYTLLPRAMHHQIKRKKLLPTQLDKTISDFCVQGDYIKKRNELIAVYQITPFDIALLNDEEQNEFYEHMKMMLHSLPSKIQIIVQKRLATEKDYYPHFFSVFNGAKKAKETLIEAYVNDLTRLLQTNAIYMTGYYLVLSTPLTSQKEEQYTSAVKILFDNANRLRSSLAPGQIQITQLIHDDLLPFCKQFTGGNL